MVWNSTQAATTKHHRLGSLNERSLFLNSSERWRSEIKVPKQSGSGESPRPGLGQGYSLCHHKAAERERWRENALYYLLF